MVATLDAQGAAQMRLPQDDEIVHAFVLDRTNQSFGVSVATVIIRF
jgi:hypothetical protein